MERSDNDATGVPGSPVEGSTIVSRRDESLLYLYRHVVITVIPPDFVLEESKAAVQILDRMKVLNYAMDKLFYERRTGIHGGCLEK